MLNHIFNVFILDESCVQHQIQQNLKNYPSFRICGKSDSLDESFAKIKTELPDIIFMNIEHPTGQGFQLARELKAIGFMPKMIFLAKHDHLALQAIKHFAFDYLLKPIANYEFDQLIERIMYSLRNSSTDSITFSANRENKLRFIQKRDTLFIDPKDIIFCKAQGCYTELYLDNSRIETVSHHLKEVVNSLDGRFQRLGRSVVINRNYLSKVDRLNHMIIFEKSAKTFTLPVSSRLIHQV